MNEAGTPALDKRDLIHSFNAAARSYAAAARLQKYAGEQLLERLEMIRLVPQSILDLGSGPGDITRSLAGHYPRAGIVELDIAENMLRTSRSAARRFLSRHSYICADADRLPLSAQSIDLVFSNLMLQWSLEPDRLLNDLRDVLRPQGLFLFSSLGPDTLRELRESWAVVDNSVHVNTFIDMHDLGDALIRAGFADPVMEVETVTLSYPDLYALLRDLKGLGAHNVNHERRRTLTGRSRFERMKAAYETRIEDGRLPATYELIFGHAWVPGHAIERPVARGGVFSIPLDKVRRALRKGAK